MGAARWQTVAVGLGGIILGLGLASWNGDLTRPLALRVASAQDVTSSPTPPLVALPLVEQAQVLNVLPAASLARQDEPRPVPIDPAPAAEPVLLPESPAAAENLPAVGPTDDPEGTASAFLDRSRKEAHGAVTALRAEVQSLRARLAKAEAGLARWQAVLDALESQADGPRPAGWHGEGGPAPVAPDAK
jgi:hypothetical protein